MQYDSLQTLSYGGPFGVDDAEIDAVAQASAGGDDVVAESAFFSSTEAQDSIARACVERVGFEFHAVAVPGFKGVAQHQVFGFGVDVSALPRGSYPSPADFRDTMRGDDIAKACTADDVAAAGFYCDERQRHAPRLLRQGLLYVSAHVVQGVYRRGIQTPDFRVAPDIPQRIGVHSLQRFQAYSCASQNNGFDIHSRYNKAHGMNSKLVMSGEL